MRFSYKTSSIIAGVDTLTFNQGVEGSNPSRLTKARRPSLSGNFEENQGVKANQGVENTVFTSFCRHFLFVLALEAGYQGVLRLPSADQARCENRCPM